MRDRIPRFIAHILEARGESLTASSILSEVIDFFFERPLSDDKSSRDLVLECAPRSIAHRRSWSTFTAPPGDDRWRCKISNIVTYAINMNVCF